MQFSGLVYRALDPSGPPEPLSGAAASRTGERFNPAGTPALYTALDVPTAVREVSKDDGPMQPLLIVAIELDLGPVFDACAPGALDAHGLSLDALGARDWQDRRDASGRPLTQAFAARLIAEGQAALLVPSFAPGARPGDRNLVLWRWGDAPPHRVRLVDDEGRLGALQAQKGPR